MASSGAHVELADLAALQHQVQGLSLKPRQAVHSLLAGRHASRMRGRGLDFEEIRGYLPGDDFRTIDWRVTARTGEPHVRVYTEERERPVLLLVDQRISMYWGTVRDMKSVTAAHTAAILAWTALAGDDRVGGIVFNDTSMSEIRPQRSRAAAMQLLGAVAERNNAMRADLEVDPDPTMLDRALAGAERIAGHDYLVMVISDFDVDHDAATRRLLRLARNNDVVGVLVHDPSATNLPAAGEMVVSDGELQIELSGASGRKRILEFSSDRIARVLDWQRTTGATMLPISTAQPALDQIRHLLGAGVAR